MTVGFENIPFGVYVTSDAQFPFPTPDENGFEWYEAALRFETRDEYFDLYDLLSGIDVIPAMAMRGGGLITRRWGPGRGTLVYPRGNGDEASRDGILVSLSPLTDMIRNAMTADARWLMIGTG